ncbi:glyoxylate/hydroxypyruvate reductase A-like [Littorina saxatilis]
MAGQASPRIVVASAVRELAKYVQRQMPKASVENVVDYNAETFPSAIQSDATLAKRLQDAEVLLGDGKTIITCIRAGATPKLKWAHSTWAGVEGIMEAFNFQKPHDDFILTRPGHGFGDLMSEYVIGQIIARERDFEGIRLKQQKREWDKSYDYFRPLFTLSIGILGYGAIGKEVAKKCKAMGMKVWAVNRYQNTTPSPDVDEFRGMDALGEVLRNCDYVCSILPHTPATQDLLSGDVLKQCQEKKSVLINIGRGSVIRDESLIKAVREGWIGGAILDVFNEEPLPADSELWSLPNIVITPHVSGPSLPDQVAKTFVDNLKLYNSGKPMNNVVDWNKGY